VSAERGGHLGVVGRIEIADSLGGSNQDRIAVDP